MEEEEKEIMKKNALLGKIETKLILTDRRVLFLGKSKEVIKSINYTDISKIQNSKSTGKEINDNTVSKIRIIDKSGIKIDFSFRGRDSPETSKTISSILAKEKKNSEISKDTEKVEDEDPFLRTAKQPNQDLIPMTENSLKAKFLQENLVAKQMYKELVVEDHILNEEEFWANFKAEFAELKAVYQKNGFLLQEYEMQTIPKIKTENSSNSTTEKSEKDHITEIQSIENTPLLQQTNFEIPTSEIIKLDQVTISNDEYKESISYLDELLPTIPDEDAFYNENEFLNETEETEDDSSNYIWRHEVFEPEIIDPIEFLHHAEKFHSDLEKFADSFTELPIITLPSMNDAVSVLKEVSYGNFNKVDYAHIKEPEILERIDDLKKHKLEQQILLVHFWQNSENKESPDSAAKAARLKEKLMELHAILESEKMSIKNKEAKIALFPLYNEIDNSIQTIMKFEL